MNNVSIVAIAITISIAITVMAGLPIDQIMAIESVITTIGLVFGVAPKRGDDGDK